MITQTIEKGIAAVVGSSDVSKSAVAITWGFFIVLVLKFSSDMVYFGAIQEGEGPELNTNISVLMADHVTTFGTMIVELPILQRGWRQRAPLGMQ